MVIDVDRCTGCGACMIACAAENNVAPAPAAATDRTGVTPMLVRIATTGDQSSERRRAFIPMPCMQCDRETPCVAVCPQQAVEYDQQTGIVAQMPQRCLGCRYCMTACPYHSRYFNWWDPQWPPGMEKVLNPSVAPRMRGVVEKCDFCKSRWHAAQDEAAAAGKPSNHPVAYTPACVEACPTHAITFGDLADTTSEVARLANSPTSFRFLARLGTEPKVYYRSKREWVRALAERGGASPREAANG
jgi:molybdopterin-containing oxidoreductase family iron-sulfur binding subunit